MANKVTNLLDNSFKVSLSTGIRVSKYDKAIFTSQVAEYLGKEGFSSKTPFINLFTSLCSPKLTQSLISTYADNADLAVQIAL